MHIPQRSAFQHCFHAPNLAIVIQFLHFYTSLKPTASLTDIQGRTLLRILSKCKNVKDFQLAGCSCFALVLIIMKWTWVNQVSASPQLLRSIPKYLCSPNWCLICKWIEASCGDRRQQISRHSVRQIKVMSKLYIALSFLPISQTTTTITVSNNLLT